MNFFFSFESRLYTYFSRYFQIRIPINLTLILVLKAGHVFLYDRYVHHALVAPSTSQCEHAHRPATVFIGFGMDLRSSGLWVKVCFIWLQSLEYPHQETAARQQDQRRSQSNVYGIGRILKTRFVFYSNCVNFHISTLMTRVTIVLNFTFSPTLTAGSARACNRAQNIPSLTIRQS